MAVSKQTTARRKKPNAKCAHIAVKVVIHPAEDGGYWAEVPALPGCYSEGETLEEIHANIREAIRGCLSVEVKEVEVTAHDIVEEIEL